MPSYFSVECVYPNSQVQFGEGQHIRNKNWELSPPTQLHFSVVFHSALCLPAYTYTEALWPLLPEIGTFFTSVFYCCSILHNYTCEFRSIHSIVSQSVIHSNFHDGPQTLDLRTLHPHEAGKQGRWDQRVMPSVHSSLPARWQFFWILYPLVLHDSWWS